MNIRMHGGNTISVAVAFTGTGNNRHFATTFIAYSKHATKSPKLKINTTYVPLELGCNGICENICW